MQEAIVLSENLEMISVTGLEAIKIINSKNVPQGWKEKAQMVLKKATRQGGRCDLQVVTAVEQLVNKAVPW